MPLFLILHPKEFYAELDEMGLRLERGGVGRITDLDGREIGCVGHSGRVLELYPNTDQRTDRLARRSYLTPIEDAAGAPELM